jgi:hypothetical protein
VLQARQFFIEFSQVLAMLRTRREQLQQATINRELYASLG